MRHRVLLALLLLGTFASASAASFDCKLARTAVEKRICADPELSRLDDQLGSAYRAALRTTPHPADLKSEQAQWLKATRNPCPDVACTRTAYQARLAALTAPAPRSASLAAAETDACAALVAGATAPAACRKRSSGAFGTIGAETFHFAIYCLDETPTVDARCEQNGVALFSVATNGMTTRWYERSDDAGDDFQPPVIRRTTQGTVLDLPVRMQGTGNYNDSDLFVRQGDRWVAVDTTTWLDDLNRRLPKDRAPWKGIWPDWDTFTAITPLYHQKDANCCPSAGSATIGLRLDGSRIVIRSLLLSDRKGD